MSIIDTLITDRTQADVTKLKSLLSKPKVMWSNEEWSEFLLAKDKGAYNATDLNRLQEAMEYLAERFRGYGYNVPEIKRPSITEVIPGTSRLPEGYTELEYIRSTGTEFVDSGVEVKSTSGFCVEFALLSASGIHGIIGGFTYGGYNHNFSAYEGKWYAQYGNNQTHIFGTTDTNKHIVSQNVTTGAVIFDGETVVSGLTFYDNTARTFRLFCYNGGDSYPAFWPGTFALYSCKFYDNGTLVRDYVPCLNPSNEVGLYDIVNGVFYGNAGSGEFIAGYLPTIDKNTLLLLHGDALEDSSNFGQEITNSGVVVSADQSKFGGKSLYFDGSSKVLIPPVDLAGNDFTIDWWEYVTSSSSKTRFCSAFFTDASLVLGLLLGYNATKVYSSSNGSSWDLVSGATMLSNTLNTWVHWAFVRKGNTLTSYRDGAVFATTTINGAIYHDGTTPSVIGSYYAQDQNPFIGYIDEFRISNVARWTEAFTPPDVAYYADETNIPSQTIVRDYWKIGDIPRKEQMELYLTNLGYVKNVLGLLKSTPESPSVMDYLSYVEANNIEQILVDIEFVITHTIQSMARLNAFMFVSGYRPFPSSASDYGRTWDDIDSLELNWDDLDDGEAWYTMQYGVIK